MNQAGTGSQQESESPCRGLGHLGRLQFEAEIVYTDVSE